MTTQYFGLAVGGMADGQRIAHWATKLIVEEKPKVTASPRIIEPPFSVLALPGEPKRETYVWTDCGQIALWLLEDWTKEQAFKHMAETIGFTQIAHLYEHFLLSRKEQTRG